MSRNLSQWPEGLPEVGRVEDRRLHLLVAARPVLLAPHVDEGVPDDHALRVPEGRARRGVVEREEVELASEPAVVALERLLDVAQVLVEVLLREEGGAVDPRQHRPRRVAAPVGAREVRQGEGLDRARVLQVRAAAEVGEVVLRVDRQGLVDGQVVDQLDLVRLVLVDEALADRVALHRAALEGVAPLEDPAHLVLEPLQVRLADRLGEVEVVVEAVVDRRADRDSHAGEDVAGGLSEDVRRRVAQHGEGLGVADADDAHVRAVGQGQAQVAQLAVDLDRGRGLREALADRARAVESGRAVGELELGAVGEVDLHGPQATNRRPSGGAGAPLSRGRTTSSRGSRARARRPRRVRAAAPAPSRTPRR